mmetsp:Transcript_13016/g.28555  ORF Transcript_13016/g.28555 Transcript_13016/m.28555 type:complete len:311 (+) Transcript_13016:1289-2221(+)
MRREFISPLAAIVGSGKLAMSRPSLGRKGLTRAKTRTFPLSSCTRLCSLRRIVSPTRSFSSNSAQRALSPFSELAASSVSSWCLRRITSSSPVTLPSFSTDSWFTDAFSSSECSCFTSISSPAATALWCLTSSWEALWAAARAAIWACRASVARELFSSTSRIVRWHSDCVASSSALAPMRSLLSASSLTSQRSLSSLSTSSCTTDSLLEIACTSCWATRPSRASEASLACASSLPKPATSSLLAASWLVESSLSSSNVCTRAWQRLSSWRMPVFSWLACLWISCRELIVDRRSASFCVSDSRRRSHSAE